MSVRLISVLITGLVLGLTGCASTQVPPEIREAPERDPGVDQVRADFDQYAGDKVRWGGAIASVQNKQDETWVEIVAASLGSSGRPRSVDYSYGRFLARIDGFLDPQIYAVSREFTVYGRLEEQVERKIGEHPYRYPVVRVQSYQLWREYPDQRYSSRYYRHPYYYYPYPYSYRLHRPYYPYYWW